MKTRTSHLLATALCAALAAPLATAQGVDADGFASDAECRARAQADFDPPR